MATTTSRKYAGHPHPRGGGQSVSVAPSLPHFSYRNGFWGMFCFTSCLPLAAPALLFLSLGCRYRRLHRTPLCENTGFSVPSECLLSIFRLPICHSEDAAVRRLLANYFSGQVSTSRVGGSEGVRSRCGPAGELSSKSSTTFPPRQRQCPHSHTPVTRNVTTVIVKCRLYR